MAIKVKNMILRRVAPVAPVALTALIALIAQPEALRAQSADSGSSNPSSFSNAYYGSVTAHPASGELLKLSLDDAIVRGLTNNLGLKESEAQQKNIHGQQQEAVQQFLPSIAARGTAELHEYNLAALGFSPSVAKSIGSSFGFDLSGISTITHAEVMTGAVTWDQTLFSGPVIDGWKGAKQAVKAAYFDTQHARGEVVQQVATAYLKSLADQAQVDNDKALLDADKVLLEQARAKHEAGTAANLDELRARVQYQTQQQTVIADENAYEKDLILLKREIGIDPGQQIALTDVTPYSDLAQQTAAEVNAEALKYRNDYQSLQAQVKEAHEVVQGRKHMWLPTLSFKGNYGVTAVENGTSHGTFNAAGSMSVPIFRQAELKGNLDVARAQQTGLEAQLSDTRGLIDEQVRAALLDIEATGKQVEVARSNVELATRALSDESDRFAAGVDDNLPLVRAQATLAGAQSNLVESLYQYNLAKVRLARATGVLETQYKVYLGR